MKGNKISFYKAEDFKNHPNHPSSHSLSPKSGLLSLWLTEFTLIIY
jgi:hypothetical protein